MDDLRDYRFYASDMVHPSETAIDYIWEKFCAVFFDSPVLRLWNEAARITRAMAHRITGEKRETAPFAAAMLERIRDLKAKAPFIDLTAEEKYFRELVINNFCPAVELFISLYCLFHQNVYKK